MGVTRFAESVTRGHPDKVADQISDAVLDAYRAEDPNSRVAVETLIKSDVVCLAGEVTSRGKPYLKDVIADTLRRIGYVELADQIKLVDTITRQSPNIGAAVGVGGAGDQACVVGYACRGQTLLPVELVLANRITEALHRRAIRDGSILPDGKALVMVERLNGPYSNSGPQTDRLARVVCSAAHRDGTDPSWMIRSIIGDCCDGLGVGHDDQTEWIINPPDGRFCLSGPSVDAGVTGRKIIMDTYGCRVPHGGGAFSGKDPTKIDRSAAYMARLVARHVVEAELMRECVIHIGYAFGLSRHIDLSVDGTVNVGETPTGPDVLADRERIRRAILDVFDLSPSGLIERLDLNGPGVRFEETARNGHFGRHMLNDRFVGIEWGRQIAPVEIVNTTQYSDWPWERIDPKTVERLREAAT